MRICPVEWRRPGNSLTKGCALGKTEEEIFEPLPFPCHDGWLTTFRSEILTPPNFHLSLQKLTICLVIESFGPFWLMC
jgi:hypothetical protein